MAVLNSTSRRAIYTSDHLKYSGGDSPIFHPLPSFVDMDSRVSWLTTINLAGVLPHEGMLPVGQLSFPLFFAWLGGFKSEAQHPNFSESSLMNANC